MQIVVTCDSYEELIAAAKQILKDHTDAPASKPAKAAKEKTDPKPADPAAEKVAEKAEKEGEAKDGKDVDESTVKVMLADKIKGGKKAEVRALFEEYGVAKLSELVANYPEKLQEFADKARAL